MADYDGARARQRVLVGSARSKRGEGTAKGGQLSARHFLRMPPSRASIVAKGRFRRDRQSWTSWRTRTQEARFVCIGVTR